MIAPDMATMLSFVFTDAPIAAGALQALLSGAVVDTFNAVTIDGDTSTSDTLLAFATGAAQGAPKISKASDPRLKDFRKAFESVLGEPLRAGRARRRGRAQAGRDRGRRRDVEEVGAAHRDVDRELAAGEDRDRRRGRQLGPRRDGGRQGRRAGRPRQTVDLVRRHARRAQGRARSRLRRGGGVGLHEERRRSCCGSTSGSAKGATGCSPATSPRSTWRSTETTARNRFKLYVWR